MGFKRFKHKGRGFKARASVRSNGQIGFSHGAIRKFGLSEFSHAVLFYDADEGRVGIKPTSDANEEGAIKLTVKENTAWIAATAFLDYHDLPYSTTKKFDLEPETIDGQGSMVFTIREGEEDEEDSNPAENEGQV